MAQHDYVIANGTGAAVRSDLNNALAAIVSQNSGSTAPATTYAYQWWADTTASVLKLRNAANDGWIEICELDGEFGSKTFNGNVTLNAQGDLRFGDSDSSNWVAFQSPATVASNVTWTLPSADGTNGQMLTTNGTGTLSWTTASASSDIITEGNTSAEVVDTGSDGHFKVVTEGTEALRVDANRRLLVGTSSAFTENNGPNTAGWSGLSYIADNRYNSTLHVSNWTNDVSHENTGGTIVMISRCKSGTVGTHASGALSNGNDIGRINFNGSDGTSFITAALIQAEVDGTPGSNDMPGRLVFSTTADGASSPTERMRLDSSGNLQFNSGYGSVATAYGCRAWVNFNGQGPAPSIRANGNVSSITDNGSGDFTVNFTTSMPDANYCVLVSGNQDTSTSDKPLNVPYNTAPSTSAVRIINSGSVDYQYYMVAVIR